MSKTLSFFLRHEIGKRNKADDNGFINLNDLILLIKEVNDESVDLKDVINYVSNEDKKERFIIVGDKIKANYGHSFKINENSINKELPEYLYSVMSKNFLSKKIDDFKFNKLDFYFFEDKEKALIDKDMSLMELLLLDTKSLSVELKESFRFENGIWKNPEISILNFINKEKISNECKVTNKKPKI